MGVVVGLVRAMPMAGSRAREVWVGFCAREVWRVGAGVGVGDEEGGRASWRRREERVGCRGAGVMEGLWVGVGERGGREAAVGEGRVDIVGGGLLVGMAEGCNSGRWMD